MKPVRNTRFRLQLINNAVVGYKPSLPRHIKKNLEDWILITDPYTIQDIWNNSVGYRIAGEPEKWAVYVHKTDIYFKNSDDYKEYKEMLIEELTKKNLIGTLYMKLSEKRQSKEDLSIYELIEFISDFIEFDIEFNEFDGEFIFKEKEVIVHDFKDFPISALKKFCKAKKIDNTGKIGVIIARLKGNGVEPKDIFDYLNENK